jgi:hypothetical protein
MADNFGELRAALVKAVQQEIRGEFAMNAPSNCPVPPPSDLPGEAAFLYSFLRGGGAHGLVEDDFFMPLHQLLFRSGGGIRGESLAEFLEKEMRCPMNTYIEGAVADIWEPRHMPLEGAHYVESILECSRARKLILWLDKLDMGLRTGGLTTAQVKAKMARWVAA